MASLLLEKLEKPRSRRPFYSRLSSWLVVASVASAAFLSIYVSDKDIQEPKDSQEHRTAIISQLKPLVEYSDGKPGTSLADELSFVRRLGDLSLARSVGLREYDVRKGKPLNLNDEFSLPTKVLEKILVSYQSQP